jgi:hypothetical protein
MNQPADAIIVDGDRERTAEETEDENATAGPSISSRSQRASPKKTYGRSTSSFREKKKSTTRTELAEEEEEEEEEEEPASIRTSARLRNKVDSSQSQSQSQKAPASQSKPPPTPRRISRGPGSVRGTASQETISQNAKAAPSSMFCHIAVSMYLI